MLFCAILAATLAQSPVEPVSSPASGEGLEEPEERDLSFTLELSGVRQWGASGFVDYGVVPNRLYLNAGYTLLKTPALAAVGNNPAVPTAPTHLFSGGLDWTPSRHLSLSLLVSGSPRSTDRVVLNPDWPAPAQLTLSMWRSNVGGSLMAALGSGGLSDFEWVADAGLTVTFSRLGRRATLGSTALLAPEGDGLWAFRGMGGVTVTLFDRTDLSIRGGISHYRGDPLTVGRFTADDLQRLESTLSSGAARFITDLEQLARLTFQAASRMGQADSLSGYASAPVAFEAKVQVRHRFTRRVSAQLGWTYNQYVPTAGYAHVFSTRVTVKLGEQWRVWGGGAVQYDLDPMPSVTGLGTIGVELTL